MLHDSGNIKPWRDVKIEFHLKDTQKNYWLQIIDALPKSWKILFWKIKEMQKNLLFLTTTLQENLNFAVLTNLLVKSYI